MEGATTGKVLVRRVPEVLARLLRTTEDRISTAPDPTSNVDLVVRVEGEVFLVECKVSATADAIAGAIARLKMAAKHFRQATPVIFVPYMGPKGHSLCEQAGIAWFDLSGNAHIQTTKVTIQILGRKNLASKRGRPQSVFAPRASRVVRCLLTNNLANPGQPVTQQELTVVTGLDKGFVSRLVQRLVSESLVLREGKGLVVTDPELLLNAWRQEYDFQKHEVHPVHRFARSGDELLDGLSREMTAAGIHHAATGLSGAWLHSHFAGFRLVTFFVKTFPSTAVLHDIGVREEPRGANVWLVVPRDDAVFDGAEEVDGVVCASPLQVFLDLKGHPERSREAAERLQQEYLNWNNYERKA